MGSRFYDPATDKWVITWVSTQAPGYLGIWRGTFGDDGIGEFFRETRTPEGDVLSRIRWMNVRNDAADWEYALSRDGGSQWTTMWEMALRRMGTRRSVP